MGKRKHIGIIFAYNENWIGGTYYVLNTVNALNALPTLEKPIISIIASKLKDFQYVQKETDYPYLNYIQIKSSDTFWAKAINAIPLRILKRKLINPCLTDSFDLLFPNPTGTFFSKIDDTKKVYWIPDFQEHYFPELFSTDELITIKQRHINYVYRAKKLVFSSKDVYKDFCELFPKLATCVHIIPFSVTHPTIEHIDFKELTNRLLIDQPYLYAPNQFWIHKNQTIVIEAIKILREKFPTILLLFSGKESDYRHPMYIQTLKQKVKDYDLENHVKFLGFLERREQLCLVKEAQVIIQPSLFEGWSTVIEDAKVYNKKIVASNLNVHVEQLEAYSDKRYFDPTSVESLVDAVSLALLMKESNAYDYVTDKLTHARAFLNLIA